MRLAEEEARSRLASHDHGILCTLHAGRGVDAVPVVYAVVDDHVGVPVDRVKPKLSGRLQRERNLAHDPRATLLIENWDRDEWSRLWWVRAELRWRMADPEPPTAAPAAQPAAQLAARLAARLADRFTQYRDQPFERMLLLEILHVTGWAGAG